MNALIPQSLASRNEVAMLSKVSRWLISPQKQAPVLGVFQDGLIGMAELTKEGIKLNKFHAMIIFGQINYSFI